METSATSPAKQQDTEGVANTALSYALKQALHEKGSDRAIRVVSPILAVAALFAALSAVAAESYNPRDVVTFVQSIMRKHKIMGGSILGDYRVLLHTLYDVSEFAFRNILRQMPIADESDAPDLYLWDLTTSDSSKAFVQLTTPSSHAYTISLPTSEAAVTVSEEDVVNSVRATLLRESPIVCAVLIYKLASYILNEKDEPSGVKQALQTSSAKWKRYFYLAMLRPEGRKLYTNVRAYFNVAKNLEEWQSNWCVLKSATPEAVQLLVAQEVYSILENAPCSSPETLESGKCNSGMTLDTISVGASLSQSPTLDVDASATSGVTDKDDRLFKFIKIMHTCNTSTINHHANTIHVVSQLDNRVDAAMQEYLLGLMKKASDKKITNIF